MDKFYNKLLQTVYSKISRISHKKLCKNYDKNDNQKKNPMVIKNCKCRLLS